MCDTTGNHSHAHGVRSDMEKTLGDIRADLADKLQAITKMEAQVAVIGEADFPQAGEVVHVLNHIKKDEKKHAASLIALLNRLDVEESGGEDHEHDHGHGHGDDHKCKHEKKSSHLHSEVG